MGTRGDLTSILGLIGKGRHVTAQERRQKTCAYHKLMCDTGSFSSDRRLGFFETVAGTKQEGNRRKRTWG